MAFSLHQLNTYIRYFTGNKEAYGIHKYTKEKEDNGKKSGESSTARKPLDDELYSKHLEGEQGLGVIPIGQDSKVFFSVIDVDTYTSDVYDVVDSIYNSSFPLIPFRSKSGGLHLYLFYSIAIKAVDAKRFMAVFALLLGLNKPEVFPKQDRLKKDQVGNWINLPYFNEEETEQYIIKQNHKGLSFAEALDYIENRAYTKEAIDDIIEALPMQDAPPCLQAITTIGSTDNRNKFLFNMARYYKTKYGDDFELKVAEANQQLDRPITSDELNSSVIASHKKKDYSYTCSEEPICSFCNKEECKQRKYGIGGNEISELNFEDFVQYVSDPPYYEWIVNGESLKFFDEQSIINQQKFRELCFRKLHVLPAKLKDSVWTGILNNALGNVTIKSIEEEDDMSPGAMFRDYLIEFLERRAMAATKEQINFDRVYKDDEIKHYVFKKRNLIQFLLYQKQFKYYKPTEIQDRLRVLGSAQVKYYTGKGKSLRVWQLPYDAIHRFVDDMPTKEEDYIVDFSQDFKEAKY